MNKLPRHPVVDLTEMYPKAEITYVYEVKRCKKHVFSLRKKLTSFQNVNKSEII